MKTPGSTKKRRSCSLELHPTRIEQGATLLLSGADWPLDTIHLKVGTKIRQPDRILRGSHWNRLLVPDIGGSFLVELSTDNLKPGSYTLQASTDGNAVSADARFIVDPRIQWGPKVPREKIDKPYLRGAAFKRLRTGGKPGWPDNLIEVAKGDWIRLHSRSPKENGSGIQFFSAPLPGACNWIPLGPAPFSNGKSAIAKNNSGRMRSIAIDPSTPSRMYAGTASGGVWKSTDGGITWVPKTDDKFSLAIGALAVDPSAPSIVYAGTGEMVPGSDYGAYYGQGLLKSSNAGDSWTDLGTTEFNLAEVSRIVVNPLDGANLFVAASNGLWESTASGAGSWTQLSANPCTDVVLIQNPAEPGTKRLLAGFMNLGVQQAVNSGSGWGSFAAAVVPGAPVNPQRIVFGVCAAQKQHIYAAFCEAGGGGQLAHVARSDDWGQNWLAQTIPTTALGRIYQSAYNLAIAPHPTDPQSVILAVVDLFKSVNGGGSWTMVSYGGGTRVHADCHTLAYHPTSPNSLFVGCDGGLFFTPDFCSTWQARNLDISTIQVYDLGQHPQYEAIMIVGSQDNGGFHFSGAPIWKTTWVPYGLSHNEMGGDAVVAQIDPHDPYYHYYGTGPEGHTARSDDGGRFFTTGWDNFPGAQWWIPFYADTRTAGIVYTGGHRVMRSTDRGTNWHEITADLATPIRAIAFHPSNPLVFFVGTIGGQVYRITGPAIGAWDTTTVITQDITATGLPVGIGISCLAADPAGNLWATLSDLMHTEGTGEFTNQHVYRLDAGAPAWVAKSNGLAMANPINAIVIDPMDSTRVFCGADRGVFAWDATLQHWNVLDQGLPNAPITRLLIHAPSRKLRAGTYGRGVWERSLDGLPGPDYFLYFRDNLVDSGNGPSLDWAAHPYAAGDYCFHWQSEDIIVDPSMQTPAVVTTPTDLYDNVVHMGGQRGANRVYVTTHNKGPFAVTGAKVRVFFGEASGGLPAFPSGLLADPFNWSPAMGSASPWTPIGPAFPVGRIEPGTTRLAHWEFVIPMSAPRHSCLLAFATSAEDPYSAGGITAPDDLVVQNRKVTLKNLDLDAIPGTGGGSSGSGGGEGLQPGNSTAPHQIKLHSGYEQPELYTIDAVCGVLPPDAVMVIAVDKESIRRLVVKEPKLSSYARKVQREFSSYLKKAKELKQYDVSHLIVRDAKSGERLHIANARIQKGQPVSIAVWIYSRKWVKEQRYSYHIVQSLGKKAVGGFTVQIGDLSKLLSR